MIRFENIEIQFGNFTAIRDLNLEVGEGEFFTFLGPSGCGKTTSLRALAGFVHPSAGRIFINGEDVTDKPIEKRGIGMVFQSYALFPTMTVEENITFGLKENRWSKEKCAARLKEVAAMVNLTQEQLKKNVAALSGGQQQRVAIARALALDPSIIVLDEPLSNLDAKLRKSLRVELKRIQKSSGTTMIYVTHDQEEALTLSDRIAVFNNGGIEQIGTPREIYYQPRSEFVTHFIGDTNRLTTRAIRKLNEINGTKYDESSHIYVRVESVSEEKPEEASCLALPAVYELEEFYGVTTRRTFHFADTELRSVDVRSRTEREKGDFCTLYIKPADLMVFPGGEV